MVKINKIIAEKVFNTNTANGCREMTLERFIQALIDYLNNPLHIKP